MTRPEVNRSWNATDRLCTWSNAAPPQVEQDRLPDAPAADDERPRAASPTSSAQTHAAPTPTTVSEV